MNIVKFLSFSGAGIIALSPFTLLVLSEGKVDSKVSKEYLYQDKGSENIANLVEPLTKTSKKKYPSSQLSTTRNNNGVSFATEPPNKENEILNATSVSELSPENIEEVQLEANLDEWLDTINPLIAGGAQ